MEPQYKACPRAIYCQAVAIMVAVLLFIGCRTANLPATASHAPSPALPQPGSAAMATADPAVALAAYNGGYEAGACPPPADPACLQGPMPSVVTGPWAPPGFARPWPATEYLCDGGDLQPEVAVRPNDQVLGLNLEDTIAHYDTPEGLRHVEPSNRVCIYSPRFAAVRQVVGLEQNDQREGLVDVRQPLRLAQNADVLPVNTSKQQVQAEGQAGQLLPNALLMREWGDTVSARLGPRSFQDMYKPYEDLLAIRMGVVEEAELAWLARTALAAAAWEQKQAVQVILDAQMAAEEVLDRQAGVIYTVDQPPPCPKLRLIKAASVLEARPGDTVDFTLRFDNVGNQPIDNVVIVDNLTTRLEYVADSAQCSIEASFIAQRNEGESLALRWQLLQPLKPGEGGVVRFRCRVR